MSFTLACFPGLTIDKVNENCSCNPGKKNMSEENDEEKDAKEDNNKKNKNKKNTAEIKKTTTINNSYDSTDTFKKFKNINTPFSKLPPNINSNMLFEAITNEESSYHLIVNSSNKIIFGDHIGLSNIFNIEIDHINGLYINDLEEIGIPSQIVVMMKKMIDKIKFEYKYSGFLVEIMGTVYICCGFPVIQHENTSNEVCCIIIIKQPYNDGLFNNIF